MLKCLSHQLHLKSYYILLRQRQNFCTPWNPNWLKSTRQLYSTFLFSSIIIIQLLSCFRSVKVHTLIFNVAGWPFGVTVTRYFRPKSGHSNERVYRKQIGRRLKTLLKNGFASFLRPINSELWKFLEPLLLFLDKKKT